MFFWYHQYYIKFTKIVTIHHISLIKDIDSLLSNISIYRSDEYGAHTQAYVTGFQNQWGADEANLEALLQYGPVATNVKVKEIL